MNHHPTCGYVGAVDDPQPVCTCGGRTIPSPPLAELSAYRTLANESIAALVKASDEASRLRRERDEAVAALKLAQAALDVSTTMLPEDRESVRAARFAARRVLDRAGRAS